MRRRDLFFTLCGTAVALPFGTCAQSKSKPIIGVLSAINVAWLDFPKGLRQTGFVIGENVLLDYHPGLGDYEQLPALAADLVRRGVNVIVAFGSTEARAAKNATSTIPIVFESADAIAEGLVDGLARPGGNLTGVSLSQAALTAKRLQLLAEFVPKARMFAFLVNPNAASSAAAIRYAEEAAGKSGIELHVLKAANLEELDAAFEDLARLHADGLIVDADRLFGWEGGTHVVRPAMTKRVPAIYGASDIAWTGGLVSYGPSVAAARRQLGIYTGRILKGQKPADLPVQEPSKFELIINLKAAKALGLAVPQSLLARADEAIE